jgi:hypothetical protein
LTVLHYDADFDHIAAVTGQNVEWIVARGSVDWSTGNLIRLKCDSRHLNVEGLSSDGLVADHAKTSCDFNSL